MSAVLDSIHATVTRAREQAYRRPLVVYLGDYEYAALQREGVSLITALGRPATERPEVDRCMGYPVRRLYTPAGIVVDYE